MTRRTAFLVAVIFVLSVPAVGAELTQLLNDGNVPLVALRAARLQQTANAVTLS